MADGCLIYLLNGAFSSHPALCMNTYFCLRPSTKLMASGIGMTILHPPHPTPPLPSLPSLRQFVIFLNFFSKLFFKHFFELFFELFFRTFFRTFFQTFFSNFFRTSANMQYSAIESFEPFCRTFI
jgi:hypothetical protein